MKIQIGDLIHRKLQVNVLDKTINQYIRHVIWADDKLGKYEYYYPLKDGKYPVLNKKKDKFLTRIKKGDVEFILSEYE